MEFPAEFNDISECPPFLLSVWDYDEHDPNDYLGSTVLNVTPDCIHGESRPTTPSWHSLKYGI